MRFRRQTFRIDWDAITARTVAQGAALDRWTHGAAALIACAVFVFVLAPALAGAMQAGG